MKWNRSMMKKQKMENKTPEEIVSVEGEAIPKEKKEEEYGSAEAEADEIKTKTKVNAKHTYWTSARRHSLFVSSPASNYKDGELHSYILQVAEAYSALNPHAAYDVRSFAPGAGGACAARRSRAGDVLLVLEEAPGSGSAKVPKDPLTVPFRVRAEVWESHRDADSGRKLLKRTVKRVDLCVGDRDLVTTIPPTQVALAARSASNHVCLGPSVPHATKKRQQALRSKLLDARDAAILARASRGNDGSSSSDGGGGGSADGGLAAAAKRVAKFLCDFAKVSHEDPTVQDKTLEALGIDSLAKLQLTGAMAKQFPRSVVGLLENDSWSVGTLAGEAAKVLCPGAVVGAGA